MATLSKSSIQTAKGRVDQTPHMQSKSVFAAQGTQIPSNCMPKLKKKS